MCVNVRSLVKKSCRGSKRRRGSEKPGLSPIGALLRARAQRPPLRGPFCAVGSRCPRRWPARPMGGDDVRSAGLAPLDRHRAAASSAREQRLASMQQLGAANDPVADLQWRLKVSEDIRRKSVRLHLVPVALAPAL